VLNSQKTQIATAQAFRVSRRWSSKSPPDYSAGPQHGKVITGKVFGLLWAREDGWSESSLMKCTMKHQSRLTSAGIPPVVALPRRRASRLAAGGLRPLATLAAVLLALSAPASPHNPDTDRFHDAGWGVFVHYLWDVQNVGGRENTQGKPATTWDALVREFDTERFAEQVQETGAPYVFFTMTQRTRYLNLISLDHSAWTTVAEVKDHDGAKWERTIAAVSARYVRVRALKPDGDHQKGGQMSVAELEVYQTENSEAKGIGMGPAKQPDAR